MKLPPALTKKVPFPIVVYVAAGGTAIGIGLWWRKTRGGGSIPGTPPQTVEPPLGGYSDLANTFEGPPSPGPTYDPGNGLLGIPIDFHLTVSNDVPKGKTPTPAKTATKPKVPSPYILLMRGITYLKSHGATNKSVAAYTNEVNKMYGTKYTSGQILNLFHYGNFAGKKNSVFGSHQLAFYVKQKGSGLTDKMKSVVK